MVETELWLVGLIGLAASLAVWDFWRNPQAGLDVIPTALTWFSSRQTREFPLIEINRIRLETRLDFSVRVSVVLRSGQ
jgi:hypothetical protein